MDPHRPSAPSAPKVPCGGFRSVLAGDGAAVYGFGDAVLAGWAADGGMLWPRSVPRLGRAQLASWAALSYPELCARLLKLFVPADDPDVTHADLDALTASAFARFGSREVVELATLPSAGPSGSALHVAELWHGPTLAFKDLGMSVLGATLSHLLARRRARLTLLVGTSGDTGSSAIEATRGRDGIEIVVLYPLQGFSGVTPVQERQMTSVAEREANVHVIGVEGTSDDLDVPMEACFRDGPFKARHSLGSVNSVNVVRLLVQAVHFFYFYLKLSPAADLEGVQFAVPCGAGGHLAAGLLAVEMGLPVRLVAAANSNDALHRLLSTGCLRPADAATRATVSPSMDIQVPYNVWRMLYAASGGDGDAVRAWQRDFARGELRLPRHVTDWLTARVRSGAVTDDETLRTMRCVHEASGYLLDPHTAVGVAAAALSPAGLTTIALSCAHPIKFMPAVAAALELPEAEALGRVPDLVTHPCVAAVALMARTAARVAPADARGQPAPPGCAAVFRRADDWEARLRALLDALPGRGAPTPKARL